MEDGFANIYGVELLLEAMPQVKKPDLLTALRRHCGSVEPLDGSPTSDLLSFVFPDYPIAYAGKEVHAQVFIAISPSRIDGAAAEPSLQQTRDWPDARSAVAQCQATILVTDFMSRGLDYKTRLALFQKAVSAVLEVVPCLGIHWRPSQRVVSSDAYLRSKQPDANDPLYPAINVRLFNITSGRRGETLMDTMGLAALGIPDLQCHFVGLDIDQMARLLFNSAYYLFDNGDIIEDGQTIQGINARDNWRCQHEQSLVAPKRIVLDLDPGRPHAAGKRH